MINVEGYTIKEELAHIGFNRLYRAKRDSDGKSFILKSYDASTQSLRSRSRIQHEYEIGKMLDGEGAAHYYPPIKVGHKLVLIIEDFGGNTLRTYIGEQHTLEEKLVLACKITAQLAKIHAKGVVHKDLKPENVLLDAKTDSAVIIDFGLAVQLYRNGASNSLLNAAEGSPQYLPPEQSGRVNLGVDFRSDYYSLGITLFELFSGRLPFPDETLSDLIYAQIAKQPPSLLTFVPTAPQALETVIQKLLQKAPANRYQSAVGLLVDLEFCLKIVRGEASDADFEAGRYDFSSRFQVSTELVGRKAEVAQLREALQRVVGGGRELVLVSGEPGVGKSALVRELLPSMVRYNGLFLSGKFDERRDGNPYAGIVYALKDLANYLMRQDEASLKQWREAIQEGLGGLAAMLTELVPEFEFIVGKQPALPQVMLDEAQARFSLAMRGLFRVISDASHPVLLFLDDLQWADANSVQFIESLLTDNETRHLLLIGSYRTSATEHQKLILESIERIGKEFPSRSLHLLPLNEEMIREWLSDTFPQRMGNIGALSALVYAKTAGNPFFVNEFLGNLFAMKLFAWDDQQHAWSWDIASIQSMQFTGNVIEHLCARVTQLPPDVFELLKFAACIGTRFRLTSLAFLTDQSLPLVAQKLEAAVAENFVVPQTMTLIEEETESADQEQVRYQEMYFLHDRIREAVYSLIDEGEKAAYHLKIGNASLRELSEDQQDRNIFEIATHLNLGAGRIDDQTQRDRLAEINLRAARKAARTTAFSLGMRFAEAGITILGPEGWDRQYETTYGLHSEYAAMLFLSKDTAKSESAYLALRQKARTRLERLKLATSEVSLLIHTAEYKKCVQIAVETLSMFGIKFPPPKRFKGAILLLIIQIKIKLIGKSEEKLLRYPAVEDPEMKALLEFIAILGFAFGAYDPDLFAFTVLYGFKLQLKHGIADPFTSYYHYYGLITLMAFGDHKAAYRFSSLSLKLFDLHPSVSYKERTGFASYAWIALWQDDLRVLIPKFKEVDAKALAYGEVIIASFSGNMRLWLLSLTGYPLAQLEEEALEHLDFLVQRPEYQSIVVVRALLSSKASLTGKNPNAWSLDAESFDFKETRELLLERGADSTLGAVYAKWMQLIYLFGRFEALIPIMDEGHRCIAKMANTFIPTEYYLYETLIILRLLETKEHPESKRLQKQLAENMKMIALWNKRCALNFAVFHYLVVGEQARVQGNAVLAETSLQKAIAIAEEKGWLHLIALGNELAGRDQLLKGKPQIARAHLEEARTNYLEWGATAKVEALEATYRDVLPRQQNFHSNTLTSSSGRISSDLDLASILASAQVISSQIKVGGLLRELMAILIKNAGAERGIFLMYQENGIYVKAKGAAGLETTELLDNLPAFGSGQLPESLLHYVDHKREAVILDNAPKNIHYGADPYFKVHDCLSVMMVPVVKEGRILGVIYLENSQAPGIFTPERVQIIQMLAGQIAVSLDNALVYENLEHLVEERTQEIRKQKDQIASQNVELEKAKQKSEDLLLNILPKEIAEELKATGKAKAQKFAQATVVFTDIIGFTQISEKLFPEVLVQELDLCFSAFDRIQKKYGLEKVKTIGDAYMCMAGVPVVREDSAVRAILAGLEMQDFMKKLAAQRKELGQEYFQMRLGMHTGEIVAGVVGTEKFAYDIWGDTVNLAARLESAGESGKVNISAETFRLVEDYFDCVHRGRISIKNKADVDMYFINGIKPKGLELLHRISPE